MNEKDFTIFEARISKLEENQGKLRELNKASSERLKITCDNIEHHVIDYIVPLKKRLTELEEKVNQINLDHRINEQLDILKGKVELTASAMCEKFKNLEERVIMTEGQIKTLSVNAWINRINEKIADKVEEVDELGAAGVGAGNSVYCGPTEKIADETDPQLHQDYCPNCGHIYNIGEEKCTKCNWKLNRPEPKGAKP